MIRKAFLFILIPYQVFAGSLPTIFKYNDPYNNCIEYYSLKSKIRARRVQGNLYTTYSAFKIKPNGSEKEVAQQDKAQKMFEELEKKYTRKLRKNKAIEYIIS